MAHQPLALCHPEPQNWGIILGAFLYSYYHALWPETCLLKLPTTFIPTHICYEFSTSSAAPTRFRDPKYIYCSRKKKATPVTGREGP
jgi:hypothetical protein